MNILLTGGAGYIGSHIAFTLANAGHKFIIIDNLSNTDRKNIDGLAKILGEKISFFKGDIRDINLVDNIIRQNRIDCVIHCAGLKSVSESKDNPLDYYSNNLYGSLALMEAMGKNNVKRLIYSSSATVYGTPKYLPIDELHPKSPTNPYGSSKLYVEDILTDIVSSDPLWKIIALRYFNPIGVHPSGLLGEHSVNPPSNLMPYIVRVGMGLYSHVKIFGIDYDTHDGTGIRDYIDIMDLAAGHLAALESLEKSDGFEAINLGTGRGLSVLELIKFYSNISGSKIETKKYARRTGDVDICFASPEKASNLLGWRAMRTIEDSCISLVNWSKINKRDALK